QKSGRPPLPDTCSGWKISLYESSCYVTHLFLLAGDIQINGVEEDRLAKPHRPIPSGRISPRAATLLYRVLFAAMWAAAVRAKTIPCTLTYSVAIVVYNEGGWAAVPVVKNVLGAVGLACYCWGTTVVL
ncbi:MAG: hypothetical protein Q9206_007168, partial [Seirophora lacunosa]